ncbi:MAG: type IV toxin-antitoxin system AbiEi family antitoxin domain-containing protein [Thermoplasmatota archaeon]
MCKDNVKEISSLSPTEQKIYSELYSDRVVTTKDVKKILEKEKIAAEHITNLRKKGYFKKIRRGLYAISPPDMLDQDEIKPDKFLVASKIKDDYYLSHHSALEFHGLAQALHNRVYITSKTSGRSFTYSGIDYKIITTKHLFGFEKDHHLNSTIKVSDREKTILDCIRTPKYAGGWEELMKSLEMIPNINKKTLLRYLQKINEKSLYQKTGFVLENIVLENFEDISDELLSKVGKRTYYLDKDKESYYVKRWNLMVPKRFKEWIKSA